MNDREVKRSDTFNRVVTFGHDNAADFTAESKASQLFASLVVVIQQVAAARTGQKSGRATARAVQLDALRLDLKNIARTAREIEADEPGFADRFRMPANTAHTALLTAAGKMLVELKKEGVAAKFVAYELPETFVADLETDLKAIDASKDVQDSDHVQGVENTAALSEAIDAGLVILGKLNAIMHNKYTRNPVKLAAWNSARHVERTAQREKAAPTTSAPTKTPLVTTA